jgi:hypothetical protein
MCEDGRLKKGMLMRHRSLVSRSRPGVRVVAVVVALGLLQVSCSSGPSSVASHESAVNTPGTQMDVHASVSASVSGPEPGETFASPPARVINPGTRVPDIRGMDFEDAVIALRKLGMDFGFVSARTSATKQWVVLEQWPERGARPPVGGRISMTVSMGPGGDGLAGVGGVACRPKEDDIDQPYCAGKLLRY